MKDPKRIYCVADDILHLWKRYPDFRLGQLISGAMNGCGSDLFYIEDEELVNQIKEYVEMIENNKGDKDGSIN